jgi:hypothetical protein
MDSVIRASALRHVLTRLTQTGIAFHKRSANEFVRLKNEQVKKAPNQSMKPTAVHSFHKYEVRPRKDHRGVDLISDALPKIF